MSTLRLWLSGPCLDIPSLVALPELEAVRSELGCLTVLLRMSGMRLNLFNLSLDVSSDRIWSVVACLEIVVHGGVSGLSGMGGSRLSGLSLDACCEEVRPEAGMSSLIPSKLKPSRQDRSEPGLLVWKCSASA